MNNSTEKPTRQNYPMHWSCPHICLVALLLFLQLLASPCLAVQGKSIYFIALNQDHWSIFQISADGDELHSLAITNENPKNIFITDDYKQLLVTTSERLMLHDLSSGKETEIRCKISGMAAPVLSIDQKTVLFSLSTAGSNDANHIWLADIESKKLTQLTHMENMQYNPIWSHNEKSIFFLSGDGGQHEDIWRLDVESGSLNQLTSGNRYNFELACSLNDEIAFSSNRSGNYEIWAMDPFGGNVRQLTHNPAMDSQPSWSPDGEHLVFVSTRDGEPALYIMDREGNNTRRLTPKGLICRNPVWSR